MSQWVWIEEKLVLALHDRMLVLHGGLSGVRDLGLLQSALARPEQRAAYGQDVEVTQLAAAYTFGIVRNHPFLDGNKRTGFVAGVLFLEMNGARFTASEEAAADAVMQLAAGATDEAAYAGFLKSNLAMVPGGDG